MCQKLNQNQLTSFESLYIVHFVLLTVVEILAGDLTHADVLVFCGVRREHLFVEQVIVAVNEKNIVLLLFDVVN